MKKALLFFAIIASVLAGARLAAGQTAVGAGVNYVLPQGEAGEINPSALGASLLFENRSICEIWYGFRLEYDSFSKDVNLPDSLDYFENMFAISPQIRYNFFAGNPYRGSALPFLQAAFVFSSIGSNDDLSRLGIGASGGGGFSYSFCLGKACVTLETAALYSAPNFIAKADGRKKLESIAFNFIVSVGF